ncbi:MAG: hypothetical protein ACO1PB_15155 [Ramlibacter sp.]
MFRFLQQLFLKWEHRVVVRPRVLASEAERHEADYLQPCVHLRRRRRIQRSLFRRACMMGGVAAGAIMKTLPVTASSLSGKPATAKLGSGAVRLRVSRR